MTQHEQGRKYASQNLDHYLPQYHFSEIHSILIKASAQQVFETLCQLDSRTSKIIGILVKIRNGYELLFSKGAQEGHLKLGRLMEFAVKTGFIQLVEVNNQEILFGGVGQFWKPAGGFVRNLSPGEFLSFNLQDHCKVVWNFFITPNYDGTTTLSTETRVCCLGLAKLFFPPYWLIVRLFSGWIRLEMLRVVKEQAEG